jgi:trypsin
VSPSGHQWAWDVWRVKALLVSACASLLLAATCHVPTFGGGTGGAPATGGAVPTGGQEASDAGPDTGGSVCQWVPSGRSARRSESPRIVGGEPSPEGLYPWMAAIETNDGWQFCGGSVIGQRVVLTAAHCQVQPGEIVHLGTVDLREPGRRVPVAETRNHPGWTSTTSGDDIAVLRLAGDAAVPPLALADTEPEGTAVAIGWGATCSGCSTVPVLRHVEIPVVPRSLCKLAYAGSIDDTMLCAGGDGVDSCQGDSGGPLVVRSDGSWQQIGVVSWGRGCADAPGVYTSVSAMLEWVKACAGLPW